MSNQYLNKVFLPGLRWYAVHTKRRQEAGATAALRATGIEMFFPRLRRRRRGQKRISWITEPMFPQYIFARLDLSLAHADVGYVSGVECIVSFGGRYPSLPDAVITEIRAQCQQDIATITPAELRPGDAVEITLGPMWGLEAIFLRETSSKSRVILLLEFFGKSIELQVSPDEIATG